MAASRRTYTLDTAPAWVLAVGGVGSLASGTVGVLSALDVIPTPDSKFGAPRWIVAVLCVVFVVAGVMLLSRLLSALAPRSAAATRHVVQVSTLLVVFTFVHGGAAFLTWAAITGARGESTMSLFGLAVPFIGRLGDLVDRAFVPLAALIMDAIVVVLWRNVLVKLLRRRPS